MGDVYYYRLMHRGALYTGTTKCRSLPAAKEWLSAFRDSLALGDVRPFRRNSFSVGDLVSEWVTVNRSTFSAGHLGSAECALKRWVMPKLGKVHLEDVSTQRVMEIRSRMQEAGLSPKYTNNTLTTLRAVLNYAVRLGYIGKLPFTLAPLKIQKKPRPTLPRSRVREFFDVVDRQAQNPHIPVLMRVMVGLGLREAEALGMRWEWFDLERRTYIVGKAKGKEARVVPVPSWLWDSIHAMPKALSEWVFPAEDGKPHRSQFCKKVLRRVCLELGLGNVTQHRLRATFATLHAEAGTPISEIQGMLGHKSISTTMIYVETSLEAKRRAMDCLSRHIGLEAGVGYDSCKVADLLTPDAS